MKISKNLSILHTVSGIRLSSHSYIHSRCGDVGLIVGGDEITVVGRDRRYTEEEIETASGKWWDYWKEYWKVRGTKDAYPEDYACEITIPAGKD